MQTFNLICLILFCCLSCDSLKTDTPKPIVGPKGHSNDGAPNESSHETPSSKVKEKTNYHASYPVCDEKCDFVSNVDQSNEEEDHEASKDKKDDFNISFYIDRSGSMKGFNSAQTLKGYASGLVAILERESKAIHSKNQTSKFFSLVNSQVLVNKKNQWINDEFNGKFSEANRVLEHILKQQDDMAIFISDGAPTEGGVYSAESCKYPSINFSKLTPSIKKLIAKDYQIITYIQHLNFNGKYYMNCGILDDDQKSHIENEYQTKVERANNQSEYFFNYKGPSPMVALIFIKKISPKLTESLIKSFQSELIDKENATSQALQIWPPLDINQISLQRKVVMTNNSGKEVSESKNIKDKHIKDNSIEVQCSGNQFLGLDIRVIKKDSEDETSGIVVDYLVEPVLSQEFLDKPIEEHKRLAGDNILASATSFVQDQWIPDTTLSNFFKENTQIMTCQSYFKKLKKLDHNSMELDCKNKNLCIQSLSNCKCMFTSSQSNKQVILHKSKVKLEIRDAQSIGTVFNDSSRKDNQLDPKKLIGWEDFISTLSQAAKETLASQENNIQKEYDFLLKVKVKKDNKRD